MDLHTDTCFGAPAQCGVAPCLSRDPTTIYRQRTHVHLGSKTILEPASQPHNPVGNTSPHAAANAAAQARTSQALPPTTTPQPDQKRARPDATPMVR
jgi:hypothetical protein